jgi:hypothetical protein
LPVIVNVQDFARLPPLEHAPDQTASRPLLAFKVIDVLPANPADAALPAATLMPAGVDVTRSPLRPSAATVNVTVLPGGFNVSVAARVTPPREAETVAVVTAATALVVALKVALVAPAASVTAAATAAAAELLESATTVPPGGAPLLSVTVPIEEFPPVTLAGLNVKVLRLAGVAAACGVKRRMAE